MHAAVIAHMNRVSTQRTARSIWWHFVLATHRSQSVPPASHLQRGYYALHECIELRHGETGIAVRWAVDHAFVDQLGAPGA
jgi:hypothetical protein